jgi:HK97 family phage portal protein
MKLDLKRFFVRKDVQKDTSLVPVSNAGHGWSRIWESYPGSWQQNVAVDRDTVLAYSTVYACVTLIAQDIGKMRLKLVEQQKNKIWVEITSPAFSPVLKKPNHFQTRIKFIEYWISSKLLNGNAYVLKVRDDRNVVIALYVLDPCRVKPYVSPDGSVFYVLKTDNLAGDALSDLRVQYSYLSGGQTSSSSDIVVPAREIIHDPMVCLYHPLVGVSPITACSLSAMIGSRIQGASTKFFENMAQPGGILTAPGSISDATALRLKEYWETNFTGANAGRVAVVGDGLKYERLTATAVDSQLIEQLRLSAETIASVYHVPLYMIGIGPMPTYNNVEALNQQYYSQCLQALIESLELSLDEGLGLVLQIPEYGVELDLEGLLRMDTATRYKSHSDAIGGGWLSPNEARFREDLPPVPGGDTPYLQQQNFGLGALGDRDADKPFAKPKPAPAAPAPPPEEPKQIIVQHRTESVTETSHESLRAFTLALRETLATELKGAT